MANRWYEVVSADTRLTQGDMVFEYRPFKQSIGSPQQVMAMQDTQPQKVEDVRIEGLGILRIERFPRKGLGFASIISPNSDPPFQHMAGWDIDKAKRWIDYRGWKIV